MKGILSMKEKEQKELFASLVKGFEKLLLYGKLTFEEWETIYNIFLNITAGPEICFLYWYQDTL